jgi:hypothetical protein
MVDVKEIAKEIREQIKGVEGVTFSVRINRQWANAKTDPHNVIWVEGGAGGWVQDRKEKLDRVRQMVRDAASRYGLVLHESTIIDRYILIQKL